MHPAFRLLLTATAPSGIPTDKPIYILSIKPPPSPNLAAKSDQLVGLAHQVRQVRPVRPVQLVRPVHSTVDSADPSVKSDHKDRDPKSTPQEPSPRSKNRAHHSQEKAISANFAKIPQTTKPIPLPAPKSPEKSVFCMILKKVDSIWTVNCLYVPQPPPKNIPKTMTSTTRQPPPKTKEATPQGLPAKNQNKKNTKKFARTGKTP